MLHLGEFFLKEFSDGGFHVYKWHKKSHLGETAFGLFSVEQVI